MNVKCDKGTLLNVGKLVQEYEADVDNTNLSPQARENYKKYANRFLSWCAGDYIPGSERNDRGE